MKNQQNKSFSHLGLDEVAKLLADYVMKANVVKACVARNRGGSKESTFNESEVGSTANMTIFKVITKVKEYREARAEDSTLPVKRQFEDVPLLVKYFDQAFENALKDLANQAGAQKRARYSEILHTFDEVSLDELHGNWSEVENRDRRDLLNQSVANLRKALQFEQSDVTEMLIKGFMVMFGERVDADDVFAKEMSMNLEEAQGVKARIMRLISAYCREEMSELYNMARDNQSHWEIGRDEAKAANKASVAEKVDDEMNLKSTDTTCEVSTVVQSKKVADVVQLTISVQILREAGPKKEVVQTVRQFTETCKSFDEAQAIKNKLQIDVKDAEKHARTICALRRKMAAEAFGSDAAA